MNFQQIRAVMFDFGFTLFYFENPSVEKYYDCYAKGLKKAVKLLEKESLLTGKEIQSKFSKAFQRESRKSFQESVKTKIELPTQDLFSRVLEIIAEKSDDVDIEFLSVDLLTELAELYHSCEEEEWKPFPETEQTLKRLSRKENLKIGLISNHSHHQTIISLLETYDLLKYFDVIETSAQHGKRKPHVDIFEDVLEELELSAEQCIMVGDEYADIMGAHRVGMIPILYIRKYQFPFEKEIPLPNIPKINKISEILDYVG